MKHYGEKLKIEVFYLLIYLKKYFAWKRLIVAYPFSPFSLKEPQF